MAAGRASCQQATPQRVPPQAAAPRSAGLVPHSHVAAGEAKGQGAAADKEAGAGGVPQVGIAGVLHLHACEERQEGRQGKHS